MLCHITTDEKINYRSVNLSQAVQSSYHFLKPAMRDAGLPWCQQRNITRVHLAGSKFTPTRNGMEIYSDDKFLTTKQRFLRNLITANHRKHFKHFVAVEDQSNLVQPW